VVDTSTLEGHSTDVTQTLSFTHTLGDPAYEPDFSAVFSIANAEAEACQITYSFSVLDSVGAATTDLDTFITFTGSSLSL
jgi:hypothetical protein